jgi:amino acid adenylation domain-containing protein
MDRRIAVVGMAGRFPDASNLSEFYRNLQQAKCSIREISAERVRRTTLDPDATYHRRGYIENIDEFDYQFFNIPYGEAIHMDPHQRLLLEVVAEAIENCGYSLEDLNNTNTAVYVADKRLQYYEHAEQFDPTLVTGNSSEFLAARINRVFNLKGGVAVIDTSCSSGLVAIHNACNELRLGYADQVLVCGVNLELFPAKNGQYHIEVDSPDGFSIPFTAASNGMVYGEAVVCVVLKPLLNALQDKDNIQAVITGSAVNNNAARAASLTAPDSIAQSEVLRKAWAQAGIQPGMLAFIEAHGSGTQLGDSLEIAGINMAAEAFAQDGVSIPISTVKSNIGHARSTAGLAGFVKAVLEIKHKALLPSVYNDPPNPHLQLKDSKVCIQRTAHGWKENDHGRMVGGVSSIGFSGTNCHVVVEQPQKALNGHHLATGNQPYVFLFSSWSEQELAGYIQRTAQFIETNTVGVENISFTLGRRDHYKFRKAFVAASMGELKDALAAYVPQAKQPDCLNAAKPIFIFSPGEHISYPMVEACCKSNRYFNERYQFYLEKVSIGIERMAPQIFRFIFQLAYFDLLAHNGITTATLLGIGTGQLIARVVRGELGVEEGLQKAYEHKPAQTADAGLQQKLERLLQQQAGSPPVFIEMGLGSDLYPLLLQHAGNGSVFFTHQLSQALPVMDIANLQAFLYHRNYPAPRDFFNSVQGKRIELPAHPFSKTRCWIREEPKKAASAATQHQAAAPKQQDIVYGNTVQQFVSALWRNVLGLPPATVIAHFFEGGGDSIKATKVIRQLNDAFDTRLDFEDLFDYPSLQAFAGLVASRLSNKQKLMLIWKDVLGYASLQETDNFFEKGGHSLLANQVLNRMKAEMKVKIDFEDFFSHPSVQAMSQFLENREQHATDEMIPAVAEAEDYPASHLQRRLWILSQLEDSSVAYNEFNAFNLEGPLNVKALQQAVEMLIRRHEGFRTVFVDGPRQKVLPYSAAYEMQVEQGPATEQELMEQVRAFAKLPFVLATGPLVRTKLICLPNSRYLFLFNIHHIIFDEWSNQVFIKELVQAYIALCGDRQPALPQLRVQYKDYAAWLEHNSSAGSDYWVNLLKNDAPALELPLDLPRPPVKTYNGSAINVEFSLQLKKLIDGMAMKNGASTFMTLTAITSLLLHRYSGQQTVLLGTPVIGRKDVEMESCIGFFANTVLLKTTIDPAQDFSTLLAGVKQQVASAYKYQLYPFDLLVEQLDITPDRSRMPLFDVMIGYQKNTGISSESFEMQGVKVTAFGQPRETSKFDLSFDFLETAGGLVLTITYNTDLFLPGRIERMGQHFCTLTEKLDAQQGTPLRMIDYRTKDDVAIEQLWLQAVTPVDNDPFQLFLQQVTSNPAAIAINAGGRSITYKELNDKLRLAAGSVSRQNVAQIDDITERIVMMLALAHQHGAPVSLQGYIEWFKENIPIEAGQQCWINKIFSARWTENVWAALATGLTLTENQQEADGLMLTFYERQLLKPSEKVKWMLVDGYSNGTFILRAGDDHEAIGTVTCEQIKPFPHFAVTVLDQQQMPAPAGINGLLSYKNAHGWQKTGIACRWNSHGELLLLPNAAVANLLAKPDIGQIAHNGSTVFITPVIAQAEKSAQDAVVYEFKPATQQDIELLQSINATEKELPEKGLVQYLREWASLSPNHVALKCGNRSMTFRELNEASDIIAQQLLIRGVQHEEIVPVFAERSNEFVASIIGIMKAGCVYLPFGMDIPFSRMADIIKDCGAKMMLISRKDQSERFSRVNIENIESLILQLDIHELLTETLQHNIDFPSNSMSDLAYVLYTSGSTGKPKGVMIEHAGLMNNLHYKVEAFNIGIHTKVIQNAPQSFDISIWQLLTTIIAGGQTIIYPGSLVEDPAAFARSLEADEADVLEVVPSYLNVLLDIWEEKPERNWSPKFVLVTGEACAPMLAYRWFKAYPGVTLVNAYGPTEASDDVTFHFFNAIDKDSHRVPIGKPVANTKIYVVNEAMELCGIGGVGEICVSGIGVGRGYLGQPERTKQVFIDDPWQPGTRLYKTGDLGFFNADGVLEFSGRKDHQVKVNGHRVETAEIEHCICQVAGVQQAVVLAFKLIFLRHGCWLQQAWK